MSEWFKEPGTSPGVSNNAQVQILSDANSFLLFNMYSYIETLGTRDILRIKSETSLKRDEEELYCYLAENNISPLKENSTRRNYKAFKDILLNKSSGVLISSLRFFRNGETEDLWKDDLGEILYAASQDFTNLQGLGSAIRIIGNQSEKKERGENIRKLLEGVWSANILCDQSPYQERAKHFCFKWFLKTSKMNLFEDEEVWGEHAVRNLLRESLVDDLPPKMKGIPTRFYHKMIQDSL